MINNNILMLGSCAILKKHTNEKHPCQDTVMMATTTSGASYYTCPNAGLKLLNEIYTKADGKLDEVVKKYKLDVTNDPIIITGGEDGNDHVKTGTIEHYQSVWNSLHRFCQLRAAIERPRIFWGVPAVQKQ